eukprot:scaffold7362_cov266-Pinguiococcus_pyrenoidosus.AAC.11
MQQPPDSTRRQSKWAMADRGAPLRLAEYQLLRTPDPLLELTLGPARQPRRVPMPAGRWQPQRQRRGDPGAAGELPPRQSVAIQDALPDAAEDCGEKHWPGKRSAPAPLVRKQHLDQPLMTR